MYGVDEADRERMRFVRVREHVGVDEGSWGLSVVEME